MTSTFSPTDRATWPELLMVKEVAAILRLGVAGLTRQCWLRTFVPAPFLRKPLRWRKSDITRYLDGQRADRSLPLHKVG